jgi:transcription elongation factor Elf1
MCCLGHIAAGDNPLQHYLMDERHTTRIVGSRLGARFAAARVGASRIRAVENQLDDPEIRNFRCRYCGFKSRATLARVRSQRMMFICGGCGEEFSLDNRKVKKALDAFANALNVLRQRLADMITPRRPRNGR